MVKKINMKLNEYSYNKLKNFNDGNIDKNLNLLMDIVETEMPKIKYSEKTKTVNAYSDTYERLDKFRITLGESRDNIITRMLIMYDEINNVAEEYVSFRLTSTMNHNLIATGYIEGGELYCKPKLPYKVKNKDMTVEFESWFKLLNWDEIIKLCLDHIDDYAKFNKPLYDIEINY